MAPEVHFRALRERDVPELEQMVFALYREDAYGETMSREKIHRTVRELAHRPDKGTVLVACAGDVVVGYAFVIWYWSNEYGGDIAVVDELYVKPSWRGKGIGTAFLSHLAAAKGRTVRGLQVEVTPVNERALTFYHRQEFKPVKNRYLFKKLQHPTGDTVPSGRPGEGGRDAGE